MHSPLAAQLGDVAFRMDDLADARRALEEAVAKHELKVDRLKAEVDERE